MSRGYFNMRLFSMLACACIYTNSPTDTRRTQFYSWSWLLHELTSVILTAKSSSRSKLSFECLQL